MLFGLGIIVDDAIVVIENTHRIFVEAKGKVRCRAIRHHGRGRNICAVLAGTLTTLAPFFPLLFWPGLIGKFMIYLPVMLIFTLTASLIVAFIMNPVFAVDFMNHPEGTQHKKTDIFKEKGLVDRCCIRHFARFGRICIPGKFILLIIILVILTNLL
jgi:multidrug efflux pump subunit AcrB